MSSRGKSCWDAPGAGMLRTEALVFFCRGRRSVQGSLASLPAREALEVDQRRCRKRPLHPGGGGRFSLASKASLGKPGEGDTLAPAAPLPATVSPSTRFSKFALLIKRSGPPPPGGRGRRVASRCSFLARSLGVVDLPPGDPWTMEGAPGRIGSTPCSRSARVGVGRL